ncbi:MAG: flagellar basal body-associated FliL family protein [Gammaproteobacteria bacterium]|nr:flagellar basal body-associated FliL family protein [Gammaproteobacteria bacterium]
MATEKELQLDAVTEPKSNKKLIIIIVAAVLVVAIGVAAALLLMGGDDAPAEEEMAEGEVAEESGPSEGPAIYIKFKPEFIVNYQVGPRQRYLQIYMEAMTRNPAIAEALEMHSPMIRSAIISLLSQQSFEHLRTAEGRADVRGKLQQEVQRLISQETGIESGLEEILFTNYVMQ